MKLTVGRGIAVGGFAAAASMALLINGADAHHPEVAASSTCANGQAAVRINSSSWITDIPDHRYNPNIAISFDGAVIGSGSYVPSNGYAFTLLYGAPADGRTHTVRATAVGAFGPSGEYNGVGEYRETTVTLPVDCESTATTTTTAPTTTAPATTTTAAGSVTTTTGAGLGQTDVTTTTVPVAVGGVVETRPDAAVPVAVIPRFAG